MCVANPRTEVPLWDEFGPGSLRQAMTHEAIGMLANSSRNLLETSSVSLNDEVAAASLVSVRVANPRTGLAALTRQRITREFRAWELVV